MFDCYYCIKSFCPLKTLKKCVEKLNFALPIMVHKSMKDLLVFKKKLFQSKDTKLHSLLCTLLLMKSLFLKA